MSLAAHQRTDEAEGMVPRAQLHLSFHGRNDLDHDTSVRSRGGIIDVYLKNATQLGRIAKLRSSLQFHSSTAVRKDVQRGRRKPATLASEVAGSGESQSAKVAGARLGDESKTPARQQVPETAPLAAGTQAPPVETISQRQPPERPSGFSVILRGRKRSLSPVTFACPVPSLSGLKRVGSSPIADGNCRGAHVAASAFLFDVSHARHAGRHWRGRRGRGLKPPDNPPPRPYQ